MLFSGAALECNMLCMTLPILFWDKFLIIFKPCHAYKSSIFMKMDINFEVFAICCLTPLSQFYYLLTVFCWRLGGSWGHFAAAWGHPGGRLGPTSRP